MNEAIQGLLALLGVGWALYLVMTKRAKTDAQKDFETKVIEAKALDEELNRITKETIRDRPDFKARLNSYRVRHGLPPRDSVDEDR